MRTSNTKVEGGDIKEENFLNLKTLNPHFRNKIIIIIKKINK